MNDALAVAFSIQNEFCRVSALNGVIPKLDIVRTDFAVWEEFVHSLAYQDRMSFLSDIAKLAPAMISLSGGDTKVLELVVDAMRDVCRQWP